MKTMVMKMVARIIMVCVVLVVPQVFAQEGKPTKDAGGAGDWPCFRGPDGDGISPLKRINKEWNKKPPKMLWKITFTDGVGHAGFVVADGKLYAGDKVPERDQGIMRAVDIKEGKEVWRTPSTDPLWGKPFIQSSPLVYEGKVYFWTYQGHAYCLNAKTGESFWDRKLAEEYKSDDKPDYGFASSPVADGQNVIFLPGGTDNASIVALDKDTGKTVWQSGKNKVSYSTPVVATLEGQKQILAFVGPGLFGYDPSTGKELWNVPWPTLYDDKKGPTPVVVGDRIFVATTEGGQTGLVDVKDDKPTIVWKYKDVQNHFPTAIYCRGRIYCQHDPGDIVCLDPATGKILWKQTISAYTSVVGVDDTVIALGGEGQLVMIDATVPEYKELGRVAQALSTPGPGKYWPAPVIANGCLFLRNTKELACFDLMGK